MLKIYGFDLSSPANKVRMTANLLGVEYEYVRLNPMKGEHKSEAHLKVHPAGKVPAIEDGDFKLFESNAIIRYLGRKHPSKYYPNDVEQAAIIDQWIDFSSQHIGANVAKVAFNKLFATKLGFEPDLKSMEDGRNFLTQFLPLIETQLSAHDYLTGNQLTLADICLLSCLDPVELIEFSLNDYPSITKWRDGLQQQAFYKKVHKHFAEGMLSKL